MTFSASARARAAADERNAVWALFGLAVTGVKDGACEACDGLGTRMEIDTDRLVPDPALSIKDGAVTAYTTRCQSLRSNQPGSSALASRRYGIS